MATQCYVRGWDAAGRRNAPHLAPQPNDVARVRWAATYRIGGDWQHEGCLGEVVIPEVADQSEARADVAEGASR